MIGDVETIADGMIGEESGRRCLSYQLRDVVVVFMPRARRIPLSHECGVCTSEYRS